MFSSEMRSIESMANAEAALAVGVPPTPGPVGGPVSIARGRGSVTWLPEHDDAGPRHPFRQQGAEPGRELDVIDGHRRRIADLDA